MERTITAITACDKALAYIIDTFKIGYYTFFQ